MPREKFSFLHKNYDYHLTKQTPQEKLHFLENTLLKRKSLIVVNGVGKKRQQKAAMKRLKKTQKRNNMGSTNAQGGVQTCPVYKCFKEFKDEEALVKHYNEAHADLKMLGLDLMAEGSSGYNSHA